MGEISIIVCNNCDGLLLATNEQKIRTCPYCGIRINVHKAAHVASAENAFQASEILRQLKQKRGFTR